MGTLVDFLGGFDRGGGWVNGNKFKRKGHTNK
jgi:hypothetical protein